LVTSNPSPTSPVVGQTIAFFDAPNAVFRAKRILTVTSGGTGIWTIVCDTTNSATDLTYTPSSGEGCCPWSDSLDSLVPSVAGHFDTLGPGEQVSTFFDAGERQKRQPESPAQWPSSLTSRFLTGLFANNAVQDVSVALPALPYACPVGTPGVFSYLLQLGKFLVFP
jgi:hypothetical protein